MRPCDRSKIKDRFCQRRAAVGVLQCGVRNDLLFGSIQSVGTANGCSGNVTVSSAGRLTVKSKPDPSVVRPLHFMCGDLSLRRYSLQ